MDQDCTDNTLIRQREGTTQNVRYSDALNPDNLDLMGFGVKEWMSFAKAFAEHVNFFDGKDFTNPEGDWTDFHEIEAAVKEKIDSYKDGEITPQLGLFICFLKLLDFSKSRFNGITKRHLDFYYKDVLQLQKKEAQPDSVYTLFELAKNASEQLLAEGALLDGGKDADGETLNYSVAEELVINKATIGAIKSTYSDKDGWYMSKEAKSGDGEGGAIENDSGSWLPFGDTARPDVKSGFTIAAPSLKLTEGPRNIDVKIIFQSLKGNYKNLDLKSFFTVEHTGEKEWVDVTDKLLSANIKTKELVLKIELDESADAVVAYDKELHEGHYASEQPLLRIRFNMADANAFEFMMAIAKSKVKDISIETESVYTKGMTAKNDLGAINLDNPFFPFGPQAKKNAKLKIGAEEWIGKRITDVSLSLSWKDLPGNLETHYEHYRSKLANIALGTVWNSSFLSSSKYVVGTYGENRFKANSSFINDHRTSIVVKSKDKSKKPKPFTKVGTAQQLFDSTDDNVFNNFLGGASYIPKATDNYFIELSLNKNFLHDVYSKIYTYLAVQEQALPNAPYTPFAENLKVTVKTTERLSAKASEITFFHEEPFGIDEIAYSPKMRLVPKPVTGGQLYIGLDKVEKDQNVQLLLQIEEGSENPATIASEGSAIVKWAYLCKNEWKALSSDYLLKDSTDDFLKTGLVKVTVPKDYGNATLFDEEYLWLRASITKSFDVVSKFIDVHTQVAEATFDDNNNDLTHLEEQLAAKTISKLQKRLATVKTVSQPYASFNGVSEESDLDYYRRISERLRHKDRAITIWDYEHLILQEFTYLHRVKCLNHSTVTSFSAPGNVLLVAIPNIKNLNVYDVFQPKLSQTKLNDIENYVNKINTLHVDADVVSPNYEEVQVVLKAKFYEGLDANYYEKKLKEDIAQYLAPWAFDKDQIISFGNAMYNSEMIFYIEKLEYVDYIKDFKMIHNGSVKNEIIPLDQKSILTSVKTEKHDVTALTTSLCPK